MLSRRSSIGLFALCQVFVQASFAQSCQWRPWAADWSKVNKGADLYPPNKVYNPTNWDFTFSQKTILNMIKDVPAGGGTRSLHMFWDSQPPSTTSQGAGSGGVYQEIAVTPGVPIQYSFHWKGKGLAQYNWFEFLLINGPFSPQAADMNPGQAIIRKQEVSNTSFGWQQLTSEMPADAGRLQTITPTGTTVTVVLKFGHNDTGTGGAEAFFDSVVVRQNNGPNLLANGDFEDAAQGPVCDAELMYQDSTRNNYWFGLTGCPNSQHTLAGVMPVTMDNSADAVLTLTGTYLENMTGAKLVRVGGGGELVATNISPAGGPNATTATVTFPTAGQADGVFDVVTLQEPLCLVKSLPGAFTLTCSPLIAINSVSPSTVSPANPVEVTISGSNLNLLTGVSLEYAGGSPPAAVAAAGSLVPSGADLVASFDLSCVPAGLYRIVGARPDACRPAVLQNALRVVKPSPAGACAWLPWTAPWSKLNTGDDLDPPNGIYDPTNWDYSLSQPTLLDTVKDTPPGGGNLALHWFLDGQPADTDTSDGLGSGGVYQEIAVQPGVPLAYSYWWKAAAVGGASWFEFMLIDGPFSIAAADLFSESAAANNPAMIRKREMADGSFGWEEVTHATPADTGPAGPRPQTITPAGSVVTVVLKAGRVPAGAMESFWDNVSVNQSGGPNLLVNGTFESFAEYSLCDATSMFQDACEENYWLRSDFVQLPPCPKPFADTDGDADVDMDDFAVLQRCINIVGTLDPDCRCFDRPQPVAPNGVIDQFDLAAFMNCAGAAGIPADENCGDLAY